MQTVNLIFYGVLQAGGGVPPQSVTSSAAMSKPSGGIRSFPSLSAWGLPTPVVVLACTCSVVFLRFYSYRRLTLMNSAFASLYIRLPFRAPEGRALC